MDSIFLVSLEDTISLPNPHFVRSMPLKKNNDSPVESTIPLFWTLLNWRLNPNVKQKCNIVTKHTWSSSCSTQYEAVLPTSMLTEQRFYWPCVHSSLRLIVNDRKRVKPSNLPAIVDVLWWNKQNSQQRITCKTNCLFEQIPWPLISCLIFEVAATKCFAPNETSAFHSCAQIIFFLIFHESGRSKCQNTKEIHWEITLQQV